MNVSRGTVLTVEGNKPLGWWTATSLATGNMIGSGIFLLPAALASFGGISVIGWLLSAGDPMTAMTAMTAMRA